MAEADGAGPGKAAGDAAGAPRTHRLGDDDSFALVQQFWLTVIGGSDAGARVAASDDRVVVGSDDACDLVLGDDTVSRFHCDIRIDADRAVITDLDSRNGTRVDGVRIERAFLRPGAVIAVGRTELRFDIGADNVELPLSASERFELMVGRSAAMRRAFAMLERAAATDSTVLLLGETGTGKELAAESIHRASARRDGPFVVVDCGAIPTNLLESELFGHERGAFTGATDAREGAFEAASGGTIFLDEIGELDPELQPKLLRVLERRHVKRVGAARHIDVDVRVVAATNRDLRAEVNKRRFRPDLYYRIAVLEVRLPPLRDRPADLPVLVDHILASLGASGAAAEHVRSPAFISELARHVWRGNARELRNYIERYIAFGELAAGPAPPAADAPPAPRVDLDQTYRDARDSWLAPFERRYIEGLLARHGGNITGAARAAGVDRVTFYRLLDKHGLR